MSRLHDRMDFDVDFQWLSSRTGQMSWKTSYRFAGSILWADIYRQLPKSTYSNSCVRPAGLAMRYFISFGLENSFRALMKV